MIEKLKILTSGRLAKEFKAYLSSAYPEIACTYAESRKEALMLLPSVNVVAGFNFLHATDFSHLDWIHSFGAGVDAFMKHQLSPNTLFTKTEGDMGRRMAEYCLAHVLRDFQHIDYFNHLQHTKEWIQKPTEELHVKDLFILGTGYIAKSIAAVFNPLVKSVNGINSNGRQVEGFDTCLTIEDFKQRKIEEAILINTLPATNDTQGIVNEDMLANKRYLFFINVGRGATVDERSLLQALNNKNIKRAILDVFDKEPLPSSSPFWSHELVTVTPHISGLTTFKDITNSFDKVYQAIKNESDIPYQINISKGY